MKLSAKYIIATGAVVALSGVAAASQANGDTFTSNSSLTVHSSMSNATNNSTSSVGTTNLPTNQPTQNSNTTSSSDQNSSSVNVNISNNGSSSSSSSSSINIHTNVGGSDQTTLPTGESGLKGSITISPSCPVSQATTCTRPYINQVIVTNTATGAEVTRFTPSGSLKINLPAGNYTLTPRQSAKNGGKITQTYSITVNPNSFTNVNISVHSSM